MLVPCLLSLMLRLSPCLGLKHCWTAAAAAAIVFVVFAGCGGCMLIRSERSADSGGWCQYI